MKTKARPLVRSKSVASSPRVQELEPRNENQRLYLEALQTSSQVIVLGPSGTGKSYVAASYAASLYAAKEIRQVVITRPAVAVGRSLGALPGSLDEKFSPWMSPILSIFSERLGKTALDSAIRTGGIRMAPLEYMRGTTFKDAFVIVEECQNLTIPEFKMLVTRIGENCNLVMNGDVRQSDIKGESGLSKAIQLADKYRMDVPVIEFGIEDIVRSDICKAWVTAFYKEGE